MLSIQHHTVRGRTANLAVIVFFSILGASFTQDPLQDVLERLGSFASRKEGDEKDALSAAAELLGSIRARRQGQQKEDPEPQVEVEEDPEAGAQEEPHAEETKSEESEVPPKPEQQKGGFEDPFADILKGFMSGTGRLKEERDKKREEFKTADADLKQAKKKVTELERQLREAQAKVHRLEIEVKAKKEAKQEAEKAVMRAYTDIAGNVQRTAEKAIGKLDEGIGKMQDGGEARMRFPRVEPKPFAEAVLWGSRFFEGKSHKVRCCDYYDLSKLVELAVVRSISLPEGVRAVLYLGRNRYLDNDASEAPSVEIFGSIGELDGLIHFRQSCCQAIQLLPGIDHSEDSSVVLYEKADFGGKAQAFLPGDHELRRPMKVSSVRVPAGLKVTLYSAPRFKDGSYITFLIHDSSTFPREETSIHDTDRPSLPVFSLKVRQIKEGDMNGLFIYPEDNFRGRAQFFESGEHYLYPESWPDVKSVKSTPKTFARFFTTHGLFSVRSETSSLDVNQSRPHTIEVAAICEPADYCGEHGKCVAPQRCSCSGSFQGQRCHLQNPDETSAVICKRNAIVLGETLPCAVHMRRFNQACNATSLFLKLRLGEQASDAASLYGSPLVLERHLGGPPQELAVFPFDTVFNMTGIFTEPFVFEVFHRPQIGAFVPQVHVLERCDTVGTSASVSCKQEEDAVYCMLTLQQKGVALSCPAHAVTVLLLHEGKPAENLELADSGEAIAKQFDFKVNQLQGVGIMRFAVEVRHGPAWQEPTLRLDTSAKVRDTPASSLTSAKLLLRKKHFQEALRVLRDCARARHCASLYATALIQLGRFEEAEPVLAQLGADGTLLQRRIEAARTALAAAGTAMATRPSEAMQQVKLAIEVAPLVPSLRLQRSGAALQAGAFSTALEEARQAQHLMSSTAGVSGLEAEDCAVLLAFGQAVLAFGHGDAARQNFNGCTRLQEAGGNSISSSASQCKMLADATQRLQREAVTLKTVLQEERWAQAAESAEKFIVEQGRVWPYFAETIWGLEAAMAICMSRHALNSSDTAALLQPCRLAVEAPSDMRERLDDRAMLRCHVALAEAYERQQLLQEALAATEAAETMLGDVPLDDMAAILRLLRERLKEKATRDSERNDTAGKPKRAAPTDMYVVLGIAKNASAVEIKRAYRQLALKYHPDKNKDPEAVEIFLDVQRAYQILSDPDLRRRYDAGQDNVDEEAGAKNMKPMKFRVVETDREKGIAKVWWYDPNTGEEGFMEMEIDKEEPRNSAATRARELYEHCCLPETDS